MLVSPKEFGAVAFHSGMLRRHILSEATPPGDLVSRLRGVGDIRLGLEARSEVCP
jgi:hypothetical protein